MAKTWSGRAAQQARTYVLKRDAGICWICGHPGADTLDHIKPRSTHPELTWEPTNWKAAHGQAQPQHHCPGQYSRGNTPTPRRPQTNTNQIHIIIGPPCAGKTTHIQNHHKPTDLTIDLDTIAQALGSPTTHTNTGPHHAAALKARHTLIQHTLQNKNHPTTWIIHTAPTSEQIPPYLKAGATLTLINPGRAICLQRAKQRAPWTTPAIHDWYNNHEARLQTIISEQTTTTKRSW